MRLIDADLFESFSANYKGYDRKSYIAGAEAVLKSIDDAPTVGTTSVVDAVPAVHCGKCKYYHPENGADYRCDRPAEDKAILTSHNLKETARKLGRPYTTVFSHRKLLRRIADGEQA